MSRSRDYTPQTDIRYRGHTSLCEISLEGQRAIMSGRVLIVGAGGLGSPVALYLAAAGVGHITVIDPDTVSLSNLQRQIIHTTADIDRLKVQSAREAMLAVNPAIEVTALADRLTEENAGRLISEADVTVDCCDNLATRLLIADTCRVTGRPYVYGAVQRFSGQVFTFTPGSPSYREIFDTSGPVEEPPCSIDGILNTVVGITGTIQATEVIKLLASTGEPLAGRLLVFDALTMTFSSFRTA